MTSLVRGRAYLQHVPGAVAGQHGHDQTFAAGCKLFRLGLETATVAELLGEWSNRCCQPPWKPHEIARKVQAAERAVKGQSTALPACQAVPTWPAPNEDLRAKIVSDLFGLADLWEQSPVRVDWFGSRTEDLIDALFPGNPLLCCGYTSYAFETKPREDWRGKLSRCSLIVPSPMSAPTGKTQDGKESAHALSNTGPRQFLVVEFDEGTTDDHAALLAHLAGYGPLVLAVHSGGKSLHGWFFCEGQPEEKLHKFMRYAASLGADSATWTRSQFVRMPDGTRENGQRQTIYYFNPSAL